jgi:hypothetical protein
MFLQIPHQNQTRKGTLTTLGSPSSPILNLKKPQTASIPNTNLVTEDLELYITVGFLN